MSWPFRHILMAVLYRQLYCCYVTHTTAATFLGLRLFQSAASAPVCLPRKAPQPLDEAICAERMACFSWRRSDVSISFNQSWGMPVLLPPRPKPELTRQKVGRGWAGLELKTTLKNSILQLHSRNVGLKITNCRAFKGNFTVSVCTDVLTQTLKTGAWEYQLCLVCV